MSELNKDDKLLFLVLPGIKSSDEILITVGDFEKFYISRISFEEMKMRAKFSEAKIAELEAAQRWISVGERVPEISKRVLVILKNGHISIACWHRVFSDWVAGVTEVEWKNDSGQVIHNVIGWLPLPQPPKPEEVEG